MVRYAEGRVMEYREAEVMDIDENLFRQGICDAQAVRIPEGPQ